MKTKLMQLADAYATQMIHAHYHPMKEARAALQAEVDRVSKDAERWKQLAYMEASRVAPDTLVYYIQAPDKLDYAAKLRNDHTAKEPS